METSWFDGRWNRYDGRQSLRREWELLLNRAGFLDDEERIFLEAAAEQGGQISRLARLTRRRPDSLRSQIRDIARRLTGCEARAILNHPDAFSSFEKACLREHRIRKHPIILVARDLGASVYAVRKTITAACAKAERLCSPPKPVNRKRVQNDCF
jgi:hypothetical protein